MTAKKSTLQPPEPIGSDLARMDAISDEEIDYSDAPQPDLADWVKNAKPFDGPPAYGNGT